LFVVENKLKVGKFLDKDPIQMMVLKAQQKHLKQELNYEQQTTGRN